MCIWSSQSDLLNMPRSLSLNTFLDALLSSSATINRHKVTSELLDDLLAYSLPQHDRNSIVNWLWCGSYRYRAKAMKFSWTGFLW